MQSARAGVDAKPSNKQKHTIMIQERFICGPPLGIFVSNPIVLLQSNPG